MKNDKDKEHRLSKTCDFVMKDFAKNLHIFPQFISKIASQDQNILLPEEPNDVFLDQLEHYDWYKKKSDLARGIRTLKEVAHYIRCIQIQPDFNDDTVWSTPDIMLTMRQGQVHDHALLMASMFRAVKYEKYEQLQEAFVKQQRKRNAKVGRKMQEIVKKAKISLNPNHNDIVGVDKKGNILTK